MLPLGSLDHRPAPPPCHACWNQFQALLSTIQEPTDLRLETLLPGPHDMLGVAFPHLDDTRALFPCLEALQPFRHCSLIDTR